MGQDTLGRSPYPQKLRRSLGVLGNLGITLSGVTPAASLYVIASVAYRAQGSGAVLSLLIAAVIGLGMACCYAELGAAMPFAGGWYYHVARALGRPVGFLGIALSVLILPTGPGVGALGAGEYVAALAPSVPPRITALVIVVLATGVATLNIRINEIVTGAFLVIELAAVLVIAVLGFTHIHQPVGILFAPGPIGSGNVAPVTLGVIFAGVATGIFAYSDYDSAVSWSEETRGPRRGIARAILWAFVISVATQLIPFTGGLLGAPSLSALGDSPAPMSYIVRSLGGPRLDTLVTIGLVLAIANATIAAQLAGGRFLFSLARDGLLPPPFDRWLAMVHPRWHSPWVATLATGTTVFACIFDVASLVNFVGTFMLVWCSIVATAALVSRWSQPGLQRPWRMPLWPVPPLVALAGLLFALAQQRRVDIAIVAGLHAISALYYVFYLYPRRDTRGVLREPAGSDEPA